MQTTSPSQSWLNTVTRETGISGPQREADCGVDYRLVRAGEMTAPCCGAEPAGGQVVSAGPRIPSAIIIITPESLE